MATQLLLQFKSYYADFLAADRSGLRDIYSDKAVFSDPVHQIIGYQAIAKYFEKSKQGLTACRFLFDDETVAADAAYFQWRMQFAHRKLKGGKLIEVPGVTFIAFEEKITVHRDYYDMGVMVYEHVPVMGAMTRWIKNKISS